MKRSPTLTIGIISDTHGLLRPEALIALQASDYIVHAGDIGDPAILHSLGKIAPVTAVRGNIDNADWAMHFPETEVLDVGGKLLYVLHDRAQLDLNPKAAGFDAVIFGHSHQPLIQWKDEVLYFNPGSAGPRRFHLPITVGTILISNNTLTPQILTI
jgi:uncharacterized protein